MMRDPSLRNFKGGSWDLRKTDRRQAQELIAFPDRRQSDRRLNGEIPGQDNDDLTWVRAAGLDV